MAGNLILVGVASGQTNFVDDFNRASLGSDWEVIDGTWDIVSNQLRVTNAALTRSLWYIPQATGSVQYVGVRILSTLSSSYYNVFFRINASGNRYRVELDTGTTLRWYIHGNISATIRTSATTGWTVGDELAVTVTGSGIDTIVYIWRNPPSTPPTDAATWDGSSTPLITFTMTSQSQYADDGLRFGVGARNTGGTALFDDFRAGSLSTGGGGGGGGGPIISSVSGAFTHGQTITINGSAFGTKTQASPLVFEDFSDGAANGIVKNGGAWFITNNPDNLRTSFDTFNARCDYMIPANDCFFSYNATTADRWFTSYWVKLAPNWRWGTTTFGGGDDGLANVKYWRLFPTGARNYSNVILAWHGFNGNRTSVTVESGTNIPIDTANSTLLTPGGWHNIQVEFIENSGVDQLDGVLRLWINGISRFSTTTLNTNNSADGTAVNKRPFIIGLYDSWPPSDSGEPNMYAYYADIYVDNSLARVEIGDNPNYDACTYREVQIPSSWSDTSIQFTFRRGNLGNSGYVFVVDNNGNKSSGFFVNFGGSSVRRPRMLMMIG